MGLKQQVRQAVVAQFHRPAGVVGQAVGLVMSHRSSNVGRNRWAVGLLEVKPHDRVLELGCGPGVALSALAARAEAGLVVGMDHSHVMTAQAGHRNRRAVRDGRVVVVTAGVDALELLAPGFDAVLAVNTVGMWKDPAGRLEQVLRLLRPGGRIAVVSQPRSPGATAATTDNAAAGLSGELASAGFANLRVELLALRPPVACVLAEAPGSA